MHKPHDLQSMGLDADKFVVGEKLALPVEYVEDIIQRLIALGLLLVFCTWSRLYKPELDEAAEWIAGRQGFLVQCQMWTAIRLISEHFKAVHCRRQTGLDIQINGWLARKCAIGIDNIEREVTEWDVTGLAPRYEMIKALLINGEDAYPKVMQELARKDLTRFEISTHPLFAEFREKETEAAERKQQCVTENPRTAENRQDGRDLGPLPNQ